MTVSQHVIDRAARDQCIDLLRRYFSGEITPANLVKNWPSDTKDAAIWGVRFHVLIELDTGESRPLLHWAYEDQSRRALTRVILFLNSDRPYLWPGLLSRHGCLIAIVLIGLVVASFTFLPIVPGLDEVSALVIPTLVAVAAALLGVVLAVIAERRDQREGWDEKGWCTYWPFANQEGLQAEQQKLHDRRQQRMLVSP